MPDAKGLIVGLPRQPNCGCGHPGYEASTFPSQGLKPCLLLAGLVAGELVNRIYTIVAHLPEGGIQECEGLFLR